MNNKAKLAFEMLEQEMEVIGRGNLENFKGGNGPLNDCVIEAIAFATGRSYNEVLDAYGSFMSTSTGSGSSGSWEFDIVLNGTSVANAAAFAQHMGLTNVGDTPEGANGYSVFGDQSVVFLDYGEGNGHAVVITGNQDAFNYYYYDPQNGVTGTIAKNSSQIIGSFGY